MVSEIKAVRVTSLSQAKALGELEETGRVPSAFHNFFLPSFASLIIALCPRALGITSLRYPSASFTKRTLSSTEHWQHL